MTTEERVILPGHVRPLKYQLTLAPDLERFTFSGEETIDLEISSCCAYSGDTYIVNGTHGGLSGGGGGLRWRYFDPKKAPGQKLIRAPLPGPSYCRENLTFTERTWSPNEAQRDRFSFMSKRFYDHLFKVLRKGAPLDITPRQVRVQVGVMEECHRRCPLPKLPPRGWRKGG